MDSKNYFLELFYRLGDFIARKIFGYQDKYFQIIFKRFEKKIYEGWQYFERAEDEMNYYGENLIIKISKKEHNNYSMRSEITE